MSDYISREWIKNDIHNFFRGLNHIVTEEDIQAYLDATPSVDVRENIHGTWEEWKGSRYPGLPICSNCKMGFSFNFKKYNFCPNCGADMRGN